MYWLWTAILTGMISFAATNIDDIFLLMLFFSQADGKFRTRHVVLVQYLGFAALVGLSLLGALVVSKEWIGLLGLVPIFLGVRALLGVRKGPQEGDEGPVGVSVTWSVAAVTFANGGDSIGIYVPLFAGAGFARASVIVAVFFALVAVWCYVEYRLGSYPTVAEKIDRYGHVVVPFVLGVYILVESGSLSLLA